MSRAAAMVQGQLDLLRPTPSGWLRGACPFCEADGHVDRKGNFGVSPAGGWHCFRCGRKGRLGAPLDEEQLRRRAPRPDADAEGEASRPPEGFVPLAEADAWGSAALAPARRYLAGRGLERALVTEAGIGACTAGRYHHRVVVPVLDGGDWVGWVARDWAPGGDRPYLYPGGAWRAAALYNRAALAVATDRPVAVVEGVFDALALWPDAVAVLGKPSDAQVAGLLGARRPVAVVLDGDAWEEGRLLAMRLRLRGRRAGHVRLPPKTDPDEMPRAWLEDEMARCVA